MLFGTLEQLRQMRLQTIPTGVFTIDAVIPLLQSKEVIVDIRKVIKHIAQTHVLRVFAYLIFISSQRIYQLPVLNPYEVGRQTRCLATTLRMSANWSK